MRDRFGAEITWLAFDLHPEYPPEGVSRSELQARRGGGMQDQMRARFEQQGLTYNPSDVVPNTRLAQQLTELARERGLGARMHDRLMDA
jgi:predicted DsbA family dithiol-disulfide isomerase